VEICTDAERVARRRDLSLSDAKLCIQQLLPGRLPTFVSVDDTAHASSIFLFIDLPRRINADKLQQYAENAARTPVDEIIFSCTNPSSALVKYSRPPGTDSVLDFLYLLLLLSK